MQKGERGTGSMAQLEWCCRVTCNWTGSLMGGGHLENDKRGGLLQTEIHKVQAAVFALKHRNKYSSKCRGWTLPWRQPRKQGHHSHTEAVGTFLVRLWKPYRVKAVALDSSLIWQVVLSRAWDLLMEGHGNRSLWCPQNVHLVQETRHC